MADTNISASVERLIEGDYYITSKATDTYVGRHPRYEDRSLLPKKITVLPPGDYKPTIWHFQRVGAGYIMKAAGAPTSVIDDKLFAVLVDEPPPQVWKIEPALLSGENYFVIMKMEGDGTGWCLNNEDDSDMPQIFVRNIIVGPSEPPYYPENEVFKIVRVSPEDQE